jgi:type I restriction enzyme R subunit
MDGQVDAQERQAAGRPVPEEVQRMLSALVATSTASGDIVDIYQAAGIPRPSLAELGADFQARAQAATNPHLAIEALRALLVEESVKATRHNLVRQRAFSERVAELMRRYTNQPAHVCRGHRRAGRAGPRGSCRTRAGWPVHPAAVRRRAGLL